MRLVGQAVAMFAVTNVDDLVLLAVFFGRAGQDRIAAIRVVAGQFLGFAAILAASVIGALGAGLLPEPAIRYLGLLPLALGLKAAWALRRGGDGDEPGQGAGVWQVAGVTFANGGDNIGVYVPVFAVAGAAGMAGYTAVFLIGTAIWCALGWFLANRPLVANALSRWGHLALPVGLIGVGLAILFG